MTAEKNSPEAGENKRFVRWEGWTLSNQIKRLKLLSDLCRPFNPTRADELLDWVDFLENRVCFLTDRGVY